MSRTELVLGVLGGLLALAVVGFFVVEAVVTSDAPPALSVSVATVAPSGQGHRVDVVVANDGDTAAAQTLVVGELLDASGEPVESAEATVDYVPAHSRAEAALLFSTDPQAHDLQVRAVGYQEP